MTGILGIDEAGRGCVIGPMVVAGVILEERQVDHFTDIGVRDSKKVSNSKRTELSKIIQNKCPTHIQVIPAKYTTDNSLNELFLDGIIQIINSLEGHFTSIIFDSPFNNKEHYSKFVDYVCSLTNISEDQIDGYNKADENYKSVSASSIIAKEQREIIMDELNNQYGNIGSGYPADKRTRTWLYKILSEGKDFPFIRHRWKTYKDIKQQVLSESIENNLDTLEF